MAPPRGSTPVASQDVDDDELSFNLADAFKPKLEKRQQRRDQLSQQIAPLAQAYQTQIDQVLESMKRSMQGERERFEQRETRFKEEENRLKDELRGLSEGMQEGMSTAISKVHQILSDDEEYMTQLDANMQSVVKAEQEEAKRRIQECWFVQEEQQGEGLPQAGNRQGKNMPAPVGGQ
ncbi:BQ2448_6628 [Microbotryum intermedium]|uniref:BQ2448_6628 protein n=1 Tax=Microbotryum intermedium TaxID=269621 RepID=A0A238FSV6_9BASI|nr:BQ2448_6628 [Microbotryum intermedium]